MTEVLAGQVRDWIGRAADRLDPQERGLAYAGGADRDAGQKGRQDLAARLREAWDARQESAEAAPGQASEPDYARSLAERLREAARRMDPEALAERADRLQQEREAEERQRVQEVERLKEQEQERVRDRGMDYGL